MQTVTESTSRTQSAPSAETHWSRGAYGELRISRGAGACRSKLARAHRDIQAVLEELERGDVDEHRAPAWELGIDWDSKHNRGQAVNLDIYGLDIIAGQALGVVQVRQFTRGKRWTQVRKNYFLVGRNEGTGLPFAHSIASRVVHAAVKREPSPGSVVMAALAWIWEIPPAKLASIVRHGDTALIPVRALPAGERTEVEGGLSGTQIIDAHILMADEMIVINDRLYARNPMLQHIKGQHADVRGTGWHRVQVGLRADFWRFARPTAD